MGMRVWSNRGMEASMPDKQDASRRRVADAQSPGRRFGEIRLRIAGLFGAAGVLAILMLAGVSASSASAAECSNEAIREEQSSTYLPNCRAYEQVTPVGKDSGEPQAIVPSREEREQFQPLRAGLAAFDGQRLAWDSESPGLVSTTTHSLGMDYLSTRGPGGWETEATVPPQAPETGVACAEKPGIAGWSRNFARGVLEDGSSQEDRTATSPAFYEAGDGCSRAEPALREADGAAIEEPAGFQNLFLRNNETGFYQLVNVTPADAPTPTPKEAFQPYMQPNFLAGSTHLDYVAFEDELPLTEEAEKVSPAVEAACKEAPKGRECWEGHDDLYVWSEGAQPAVRLVSILPDGKPAQGVLAGSTRNGFTDNVDKPTNIADYRHAVSSEGSRIFFEAKGNLYVRENAWAQQSAAGECSEAEQQAEPEKACTLQLDLPNEGTTGLGGGGTWLGASEDGSRVAFTDEQDLTEGATAAAGEPDLYEYDFEAPQRERLKDLTANATEPAGVLGVSGISEDGSYVYFVANGKLPGDYEVSGRDLEAQPEPTPGADNLYVSHEGSITFIATLSGEDLCDWTSNTGCKAVEPNNTGETGLTARISGNGRYLAFNSVNRLTAFDNTGPLCAPEYSGGVIKGYGPGSCAEIYLYEAEAGQLVCASCKPAGPPSGHGAVIDWPTVGHGALKDAYPQRNVSESGQVFFETGEALLPQQDINGQRDVYEYEHGTLALISSGASAAPSYFVNAGSQGNNVFFATARKLERWDTDSVYDIYDARVGGGFPEPAVPEEPCESEVTCKAGVPAPAAFSAPSSATLFGAPDNLQPQTQQRATGKGGKSKHLSRRQKLHALRRCKTRFARNMRRRHACKQRARMCFLTRGQKLHRALRVCRRIHKDSRRRQRACGQTARRRYGAKAAARAGRRGHGRRRHGGGGR